MTGYGRAEKNCSEKNFSAELRSLNGKQYDLRMSLPAILKPYEFEIRSMLNEGLLRGSIECTLTVKQSNSNKLAGFNEDILKTYYQSLADLAKELNATTEGLFATILRMQEVAAPPTEMLSEEDWQTCKQVIQEAINNMNLYRSSEGKILEQDLLLRIQNILKLQETIMDLEPVRRKKIQEGLKKILDEQLGADQYDANRMEQELIYYIEKIDISEEQVRLKNHCDYFKEILEEQDISKGKKLSFVLQEMGREINTTGSKAYDAAVQKCVVLMKDELEKAKEQILNIL